MFITHHALRQISGNITYEQLSPNSITPTLRQSPGQVRNKVAHLSWTQIMKVVTQITSPTFMICVRNKKKSVTYSIKATQTGLSWTCHGFCRKHLDTSRWFVSATFVICVSDFHRNFVVSWFVTVCVCDFQDLCSRLSQRGSFGESQRNGIWALPATQWSSDKQCMQTGQSNTRRTGTDRQTDRQCSYRQTIMAAAATAVAAAAASKRVKNNWHHPTTQVLDQAPAASTWPEERAVVGHLMTIRQLLWVLYQFLPSSLNMQQNTNICQSKLQQCKKKQ